MRGRVSGPDLMPPAGGYLPAALDGVPELFSAFLRCGADGASHLGEALTDLLSGVRSRVSDLDADLFRALAEVVECGTGRSPGIPRAFAKALVVCEDWDAA